MANPNSPFQLHSHKIVSNILSDTNSTTLYQLEKAQRALSQWRQKMLANTHISLHGNVVYSGPFKGMLYTESTEGCFLPRLLGCYEAEIHKDINNAIETDYSDIIDIGCAEGFYAVGMARRMRNATIYAHDINPIAQIACRKLAELNNVSPQIKIGGLFQGEDFENFSTKRTLLICDIEGAEFELLQPEIYPALKKIDIIVEVHECLREGLIALVENRFGDSHYITWKYPSISALREIPEWAEKLSHLDQLLCSWEWRSGSTPWAIMKAKK